MVGLSLSFCVRDILCGKVQLESVRKIIASTCFANDQQFEEVIQCYRKTYWYKNPDEGERIARVLRDEGKIVQPKLEGRKGPNISFGHWVPGRDMYSIQLD